MDRASEIKKYDVVKPSDKYLNEILRIIAVLVTFYGGASLIDSFSSGAATVDRHNLLIEEIQDLRSNSSKFSMVDLIPDSANIIESMGIMDVDTRTGLTNAMTYLTEALNQLDFEEHSSMSLIIRELDVFKARLVVTEEADLLHFVQDFRKFINRAIIEIKNLPEHLGRILLSLFLIVAGYLGVVKTSAYKEDVELTDKFNRSARMVDHTLNTMIDLFDPESCAETIPLTVKNDQSLAKYHLALELKELFYNTAPLDKEKDLFLNQFSEINDILRSIIYANDIELIQLIRKLRQCLIKFHSTLINHSKNHSKDSVMSSETLFYVTHLGELIRLKLPTLLDRLTSEEDLLKEA